MLPLRKRFTGSLPNKPLRARKGGFSEGLVFAAPYLSDVVNNIPYAARGADTQVVAKQGLLTYCPGSAINEYIEFPNNAFGTFDEGLTIALSYIPDFDQASPPHGTTGQVLLDSSDANTEGIRIIFNAGGGGIWRFRMFVGGVGTNLNVSPTFSAGDRLRLVFTYDGANMRIYQNGVELGDTAVTGSINSPVDNWRFGQFLTATSGDEGAHGTLSNIMVWDRALSAGEVNSDYRNPFQVYEPANESFYFTPTAAPGRSITNIDGDNSVQAGQTNVDITATGLDASPATQAANLILGTTGSAALTVNSWAATNVNVDIPLHIDLKWGVTNYAVELTDDTGTVTGSANVTLATAAGWQTITFNGTIPTASTTESFYEAALTDADLGGAGYTMATTGNDILLLGTTDSTLTVNADTTFSVDPAKAISADYKIWSESNQSFSDVSDFAITISGSISASDESPISTNAINTAFAIRDAITTNAITKSEG